MCGIFGHYGGIEERKARFCLDKLTHRGPDGSGLWQKDLITLGHRRLSILDLSPRGAQPMSYDNGRFTITFNGEIYNFVELKEQLIQKGYVFLSDSDTEIILAAYQEWGEKCLEKFNGMWAFAIWDDVEKTLFLSRDRLGKKPLFYSHFDNNFVFASEMKAITPLLKTITPNKKILSNIDHIFYYECTDKCLIEEISRFPAGSYGYFKKNKLTIERFWNTLDHLEKVPEKYEDQVKKFKELFIDACKIRMRSDVPIGTALSGGVDSGAVISILAHISKTDSKDRVSTDWQHAYTASFPGTPLDEIEYAKKVSDNIKVPLHTIEIDPLKHIQQMEEYMYLFEDIYITSPIPFVQTYGAMRKDGIIVTLDGHGADELFGGYSFDYLHILHDELFNFKSSWEIIQTYFNAQILDPQFKQKNKIIFYLKQFAKNLAKIVLNKKNVSKDNQNSNWNKLDYFTQKLYISTHETVLPTLLRNYDRYSMINGIEIRMPFLDHRLLTYAFSLPWQAKVRNGYSKNIVRDAVAEFMPHDVVYRKTKVGFNSPITDWLRGPLKSYFTKIFETPEFRNSKLISQGKVLKQFKKVTESKNPSFTDGETFWKLMTPFFWENSFYKKILNERL